MPLGRIVVTSFVMLAGTLGLAACGGDDRDSMRATLTDKDCTYDGATTPPSGVFTVAVNNQTNRFANFILGEYLAGPKTGNAARVVTSAPPPGGGSNVVYFRPVSNAEVEPAVSELPANQEPAGTYVVVCIVHPAEDVRQSSSETRDPTLGKTYVAGLLDVGMTG
jgi:hypothetical protein